MKCEQIAIQLHVIINLVLQQLVSDTISTWKTYTLSQDFKVNGMCGTCT
jgi:hypothetical protein